MHRGTVSYEEFPNLKCGALARVGDAALVGEPKKSDTSTHERFSFSVQRSLEDIYCVRRHLRVHATRGNEEFVFETVFSPRANEVVGIHGDTVTAHSAALVEGHIAEGLRRGTGNDVHEIDAR